MILKKREKDFHLEGLKALVKRLPDCHPLIDTINKKIAMMTAGIRGESKLEAVFENYSFLDEVYILQDISFYSTGYAQIDCLVISPHFALILEVKNIAGEMSFLVGTGQISRILENGQIDHFESPMVQIDRNSDLLNDWFRLNGFQIPILGAVVLPYATQKVNVQLDNYPVLFPGEVPSFIKRLMNKKPTTEAVLVKDIAEKLVNEHQLFNPFPICKRWNVDGESLKRGVFCTKCSAGMMLRYMRTWVCQVCLHKDPSAHQYAIKEWFMLVGGEFTNKICRDFLNIQSNQFAWREMSRMGLVVNGIGKSTTYRMVLLE